jgi:hypothetical protein
MRVAAQTTLWQMLSLGVPGQTLCPQTRSCLGIS